MRWREIALRLAVIAGFYAAMACHFDVWVTFPLAVSALAATGELAIRPFAQHTVDRVLLASGAVVTALILLGLVLNETPWGLTRTTWTITWTIVSTAVLVWRRNLGARAAHLPRRIISLTGWILAAALIFAFAGQLAVAGARDWEKRPVLALALVSARPGSVSVEIDATSTTDTYRIVATSKVPGAREYVSPAVVVNAGGDRLRLVRQVPVNTPGVWTISLEPADRATVLRWIRVNVG